MAVLEGGRQGGGGRREEEEEEARKKKQNLHSESTRGDEQKRDLHSGTAERPVTVNST